MASWAVIRELDLHVNALIGDIELPADLVRERHRGDDLAHQRAFLALIAQLDGGLFLQVAHLGIPNSLHGAFR